MIRGNWNKVEAYEEGGRRKPPAGGYVIVIKHVNNVEEKSYLEVEYDIAEGDFAGYYQELYTRAHFWGGKFYTSYGEKAQGFFKGFITAVQESNPALEGLINSKGEIDETKLVGALVGIVLQEEEYIGNDGSIKTRLRKDMIRTADKIRTGDYSVPEPKRLEARSTGSAVVDTTESIPDSMDSIEEDLPF